MLGYVILGLLRNGQTSHGYQLSAAYHERSGRHGPALLDGDAANYTFDFVNGAGGHA